VRPESLCLMKLPRPVIPGVVWSDISHLTCGQLHHRAVLVPIYPIFGERGRRIAYSPTHWPRKSELRPYLIKSKQPGRGLARRASGIDGIKLHF
jgi:hypothetical protein